MSEVMKEKQKRSWYKLTKAQTLGLVILLLLGLLFINAAWGTNGPAAGASIRRGHSFHYQAHQVVVPKRLAVLALAPEKCWTLTQTWNRYDVGPPHKVKYAFTSSNLWCERGGFIDRFPTHQCWNSGGYWSYVPSCTVNPGGTGFESIQIIDQWHYKFQPAGTGPALNYYPHVVEQLHANGGVTGTVYWT